MGRYTFTYYSDSNPVSLGAVPFRDLSKALHFKGLAKRLQKKYPRSWRSLKWARRARWLRRARNLLVDSPHHIAKRMVEVAKEYSAVVVLEDLEKLRKRANGTKLSWESRLWSYRRVQFYTEFKALIEGIKAVYVDPRSTSKASPNWEPPVFINYRFVQLGDTVTAGDVVESWNLALRGLKQVRGLRAM